MPSRLQQRLLRFTILVLLGLYLSQFISPVLAKTVIQATTVQDRVIALENHFSHLESILKQDLSSQEQIATELYQTGKYGEAITVWQETAQIYQKRGEAIAQARVLSNLALAYQKLGNWQQAQLHIHESLKLLEDAPNSALPILAQALNTQATLQLALGQGDDALLTWQKSEQVYQQINDQNGVLRSKINQAQAMQSLGLYRRALKTLETIAPTLETIPDVQLRLVGSGSFAQTLRLIGDINQSRQILEKSLAICDSDENFSQCGERLGLTEEIATTLYSLGNTARIQQEPETALNFYSQALQLNASSQIRIITQLAQLNLCFAMAKWQEIATLIPTLKSSFANTPLNQNLISAQISFANYLMRLQKYQALISTKLPTNQEIAALLADAVEKAEAIGDPRSKSYAYGYLGKVYEQNQQWQNAQELTEKALLLAINNNTPDIAYRWHWQLGRILAEQKQQEPAISAYTESVRILRSLGNDLVAVNPDVQFSFQESIEPVYRELVALLLQPEADGIVSQNRLNQAREVIESLQLAELDDFFREACLETKQVQIDQVDKAAAVVYPIILGDRLEVVISLPQQKLLHHSIKIPTQELENLIERFQKNLVIRSRRDFYQPAQQLYDWLIRPQIEALDENGIKTLVFVLDGALRNIPMATLYDGEKFLVQKYNIALTPGLQLVNPLPWQQVQLKTLAAGLTQERQGFAPLDYVEKELEEIKHQMSSLVLLDQDFTSNSLQEKINISNFPIIHIATHGQFSSSLAETFLLAWDQRITIKQLDRLLEGKSKETKTAIELLVLSACQTALGDKRAALGLAGMAVKAGARSTVATLWSVNDQATAELIKNFYAQLKDPKISKAEALRQAQLTLLENPWYKHPFYWAPYVLVGNWL